MSATVASIRRKIDTAMRDPVGCTRVRTASIARQALQAWARSQLRKAGVWQDLRLFSRGRPSTALAPNHADLWFLYRTVRRRRPRIVWEFGAGHSTVAIAHALRNNGVDGAPGKLYSMDTERRWADSTRACLPPALAAYAEISFSPVRHSEYAGTPVFEHTALPAQMPNLVYLDGPALSATHQVASDLLRVESELPPNFYLIVDGRATNALFLRTHLRRSYGFKARTLCNNFVFWLRPWDEGL